MLAKLEDVTSRTGRSRNGLVQMCSGYVLFRMEIAEESGTPVSFRYWLVFRPSMPLINPTS